MLLIIDNVIARTKRHFQTKFPVNFIHASQRIEDEIGSNEDKRINHSILYQNRDKIRSKDRFRCAIARILPSPSSILRRFRSKSGYGIRISLPAHVRRVATLNAIRSTRRSQIFATLEYFLSSPSSTLHRFRWKIHSRGSPLPPWAHVETQLRR